FRACEVGNVFTLYTKFSDSFGFKYQDQDGTQKPVYMGCYGIGTSRVMGVLAEVYHDDRGLLWPAQVAPAFCHFIPIAKKQDEEAYKKALELYEQLQKQGTDCLFDDRLDQSVGFRMADADLIGIPWRIVISPKSLEKNAAEIKQRSSDKAEMIP